MPKRKSEKQKEIKWYDIEKEEEKFDDKFLKYFCKYPSL